MPGGCIDMQSPRLRFPRHDRHLRSILLRPIHRRGTVCARISCFLDLPFRFFLSRSLSIVRRSAIRCRTVERGNMVITPRRQLSAATSLRLNACTSPNSNCSHTDLQAFVRSLSKIGKSRVDRLIVRQYRMATRCGLDSDKCWMRKNSGGYVLERMGPIWPVGALLLGKFSMGCFGICRALVRCKCNADAWRTQSRS